MLKPSKLQRHLYTKYPGCTEKSKIICEEKGQASGPTGSHDNIITQLKPSSKASYMDTIWMLLSNDTTSRRIVDMTNDNDGKPVERIKKSPYFAIHETTGIGLIVRCCK